MVDCGRGHVVHLIIDVPERDDVSIGLGHESLGERVPERVHGGRFSGGEGGVQEIRIGET